MALKKLILACFICAFLLVPTAAFAATPPTTSALMNGGRWIGFYVPGVPTTMNALTTLESQIATTPSVINFYVSDGESFPAGRALNARDHGSIPLITLNFTSLSSAPVSSITNGAKDSYLHTWARNAKAFGGDVWVRPFNEMNGDWAPWYGLKAGNTTADVVAAWRHIKDIFVAEGATNVRFVWCVNTESVPNTSANAIARYWPGDAYVDLVSLDGYNWGNTATWSTWKTFGQVFASGYAQVTSLTAKPLFIGETASCEQGGSKAAWITGMFQSVPASYPRIRGVVWFDANKERDWRVDSSATSLAAYKTAVATWGPATTSKRVRRLAGATRYSTAVAISNGSFTSADTVVIASGLDFADALAGAPLAGTLNAPLLLVPGTTVPAEVAAEISRLGATKAIIAGGPLAVGNGVRDALAARGLVVERVMGTTRYGTAAEVARKTAQLEGTVGTGTVLVARGDSFADALAVSSAAYGMRFPILLVRPNSAPAETLQALRDLAPGRIVIVGGTAAISTGVENTLRGICPAVTRLQGPDRYATSAAVAQYSIAQGWAQPGYIGLAAGNAFPDALGGGAATGSQGGVLLLTAPAALSTPARAFLATNEAAVSNVTIFGGILAVRPVVETAVGNVVP